MSEVAICRQGVAVEGGCSAMRGDCPDGNCSYHCNELCGIAEADALGPLKVGMTVIVKTDLTYKPAKIMQVRTIERHGEIIESYQMQIPDLMGDRHLDQVAVYLRGDVLDWMRRVKAILKAHPDYSFLHCAWEMRNQDIAAEISDKEVNFGEMLEKFKQRHAIGGSEYHGTYNVKLL